MKNIICFLVITFCFAGIAKAQTFDYADIRRNGVYVAVYPFNHDEGIGYVSVNYERVIGKKKRALLGLGIYPDFGTKYTYIAFPITFSMITHPLKKHHLEYGIGIAPTLLYDIAYKKWWSEIPFLIIPIMYRYQKNEGLFIRSGVNLIVAFGTILHPSISIGYKF